MKTAFVNTLKELMQHHPDIIGITADMGFSVFENIQQKFPKRFFNTGVTEQSSIGLATGLALSGYTVFFYAQAAFASMRCFEQVRLDVGYNNVNVKIVGTTAGFSLNQLGVSHFALEDVGLMRLIPTMTIFTPGDPFEADWATRTAYRINGPAYIRLTKGGTPAVHTKKINIKIGEPIQLTQGSDLTICVSGSLLPEAHELTKKLASKFRISLYSFPSIKPINYKKTADLIRRSRALVTLEEHSIIGGLGSVFAEIISESRLSPKFLRLGVPDKFTAITGSHEYLLDYNELSVTKLSRRILTFMHE